MNTIEMNGFLTGKCLPGDMRVNETDAEYLVRKFAEKDEKIRALTEQRDALVMEMVTLQNFCKNASFDADYEAEIGMEYGGFTDALNAIKTPATDAAIAALRAEAFNDLCKAFVLHKQSACLDDTDKVSVREATDALLHCAEQLARQLRESKGANHE